MAWIAKALFVAFVIGCAAFVWIPENNKCREAGGVPRSGLCINQEAIVNVR